MNNRISAIFFIKTLFIIFTFVGIGYFVKGLFEQSHIKSINGISFLAIPDKAIDSVIAKMTLDQKLNLILRRDLSINQDNGLVGKNPQLSENKEINNSVAYSGKNAQEDLQKIFDRIDEFIEISGNGYFNSITDSSFIKDYLLSRLYHPKVYSTDFLFIPYGNNDFISSFDSSFMVFQKKRLKLAQQTFRDEKRLLGIKISFGNLKKLDSINSLMYSSLNEFYYSLRNDMDFVFIDSLSISNSFSFVFKGLCIGRLTKNTIHSNEDLITLLKKPNDIYLVHVNEYQEYKNRILELLNSGKIDLEDINNKLKKILKAKIWSSSRKEIFSSHSVLSDSVWQQQLVEKSICLLNNPDSLIPIKRIDIKPFTIVWIGNSINNSFIQNCSRYVSVNRIQLNLGEKNWQKKLGKLHKNNFLIFVLDTALNISSDIQQFNSMIKPLDKSAIAILNFGNYQNLKNISDSIACVQVHTKTDEDFKFAAQAIFGGISIQGQLPFKVNDQYPFALKKTSSKTRLKYGLPGDVGVDANKLMLIDQIVQEGIANGAFPGSQVFVAKDGVVIYDKSFGYHTWTKDLMVKPDDVYDLASVTKISSTTIATMKMITDHKMNLNDQLGKFFKNTTIDYTRIKSDTLVKIDTFIRADIQNWQKFLKQNDTLNINDSCFVTIDTIITKLTPKLNIFKVSLNDLLMHKSGIIPATPIFRYIYYREYFIKQMRSRIIALHGKVGEMFNFNSIELPASFPDNTNLSDSLKQKIKLGFKKQYDEYFSKQFVKDSSDKIRLTENLYLRNKYIDTIWRDTKQLPVYSKRVFQYSDVNMILLQLAIDSLNHSSIDEYMKKAIYKPLGLKTITYLPLKYYSPNRIIPTEMDDSWRYGYLHGFVHDPSSALMGGMVGNAGLYSNAHDLGVLFQMVLSKGSYGGIKYIDSSVIQTFTKRNDDTQRGLGFDMPNLKAAVGTKASKNTYGHTGYTGTCVWVDPDSQLVYVFLSNRNNPSSKNWRLNTYKIRERVHDAIYNSFIEK